jgi:hypothetical protein
MLTEVGSDTARCRPSARLARHRNNTGTSKRVVQNERLGSTPAFLAGRNARTSAHVADVPLMIGESTRSLARKFLVISHKDPTCAQNASR